jgi:two-component system phosphate regulon response regulator PhoB
VSKGRILIVEDDPHLVELLRFHLAKANYKVEHTADGEEAMLLVAESRPDLILLDWMIEGTSGLEVCRRLRRATATKNIPIVMLTARGEEAERIRGLETGADDYVTKPFSPRELVARIEAVLRRLRPALVEEELSFGDIVMNLASHRVTRGGKPLSLGPTEFRLLREFLEAPRRVLSRERLLETVWRHQSDINTRTVDVQVKRLRSALNENGAPNVIRTVRSAGYSLDDG